MPKRCPSRSPTNSACIKSAGHGGQYKAIAFGGSEFWGPTGPKPKPTPAPPPKQSPAPATCSTCQQLRSELAEFWTMIVHTHGIKRNAGAFAGWWDCSVDEDAQVYAEKLVNAGLWEKHPTYKNLLREIDYGEK